MSNRFSMAVSHGLLSEDKSIVIWMQQCQCLEPSKTLTLGLETLIDCGLRLLRRGTGSASGPATSQRSGGPIFINSVIFSCQRVSQDFYMILLARYLTWLSCA